MSLGSDLVVYLYLSFIPHVAVIRRAKNGTGDHGFALFGNRCRISALVDSWLNGYFKAE